MTFQTVMAEPRSKNANRPGSVSVNWRLFIGTLVLIPIVAGLVHWRYWSQLDNTATQLLLQADRLQEEGSWRRSAQALYDYLRLVPEDEAVWSRLALLYGEEAETYQDRNRAIEFHNLALGSLPKDDTPERQALNASLADLYLGQGRFSEAKVLVDESPVAGHTRLRVQAIALGQTIGTGQSLSAVQLRKFSEILKESVEANPTDVPLVMMAARMLREGIAGNKATASDQQQADEIVTRLVDEAAASSDTELLARALLARHGYADSYGGGADGSDLSRAIELDLSNKPLKRDVLVVAGRYYLGRTRQASGRQENMTRAEGYFRQAIELDRSAVAAYDGLGSCLLRRQDGEAAIAVFREGIQAAPNVATSIPLRMQLVKTLVGIDPDVEPESLTMAEREWKALDAAVAETVRNAAWDVTKRKKLNLQSRVQLLEGRLLIAKRNIVAATNTLVSVSTLYADMSGDDDSRQIAVESHTLRAMLAAVRGKWTECAKLYDELSAMDPQNVSWHVASAEAWQRAGELANASASYQRAKRNGDASLGVHLAALQSEYVWQQQRELDLRDWKRFDNLFEQGTERFPAAWQFYLLDASRILADGRNPTSTAKAIETLRVAEQVAPTDPIMWSQLVDAYERLGSSENADRALETVRELTPEEPGRLALVSSRLTLRRGDLPRATQILEDVLKDLPEDESRDRVLWQLARLQSRSGNLESARTSILQLTDHKQVAPLLALAEIDLQRNDLESLPQWEDTLSKIEGPDGVGWRYVKARRLILESDVETARKLVDEVQSRQPAWPPGLVLVGDVRLRQKDLDGAINAYLAAIKGGDTGLRTFEKLIATLYSAGRYAEVRQLANRFSNVLASSQGAAAVSVALSAETGDWLAAMRHAKSAAGAQTNDPISLIWMGQVLAAKGEPEAAEEALISVTKQWPDDRRSWIALLQFHAARGDITSIASVVDRIGEDGPPAEDVDRQFVLALASQWQGKTAVAIAHYESALELAPDDNGIRIQFIQLLMQRGKNGEAERQLRLVLEKQPDALRIRRMLAQLLAERGGDEAWAEIPKLVDVDEQSESVNDQRYLAILKVRTGQPKQRAEAKEILLSLVERGDAMPGDLVLLAVIHVADGENAAARSLFEQVVRKSSPLPTHIVTYLQFLISDKDLSRADELLVQFDKLSRGTPQRLQFVAMRANWRVAKGKTDGLGEWVDGQLANILADDAVPLKEDAVYQFAANLLGQISRPQLAEAWYRKLIAVDPKQFPRLAIHLASNEQFSESLELVLARMDGEHSKTAIRTAILILLDPRVPDALHGRVESKLTEAMKQHDRDVDVLFDMSNYVATRGRGDDAIRMLSMAAELRPDDVRVRNNLATLLGEKPNYAEAALEHIDHAIRVAGTIPVLLETKATIMINVDAAKAVSMLEGIIAAVPKPDPRSILHLAKAYRENGQDKLARQAMKRVLDSNIGSFVLTQADRDILEQLPKELELEVTSP